MSISEVEGDEGRASTSNSTSEIDFANGVLGGPFWATRKRIACGRCGAVEAVQTARPVNGDTTRTSVSEGKTDEGESLDVTQDGAGAPLCQEYNLSSGLVYHEIQIMSTQRKRTTNLGQGRESTPVLSSAPVL